MTDAAKRMINNPSGMIGTETAAKETVKPWKVCPRMDGRISDVPRRLNCLAVRRLLLRIRLYSRLADDHPILLPTGGTILFTDSPVFPPGLQSVFFAAFGITLV